MREFLGLLVGLLGLGTVLAGGAQAVGIDMFSPEGSVREVRQVSVRFTTPMVALGDPRLPVPFQVECPVAGKGRWVDPRNWVYDFEADLPSGLSCTFTPMPELAALDGSPVAGNTQYEFQTGGPAVRASLPWEGDTSIDENQVFLLAPDGEVAPESVATHVHCEIASTAEQIGVDVLEGEAREQVLAQRRQLGYGYRRLLWEDGGQGEITDEAMREAESSLVVVRCRRAIPPETEIRLVWGRGIAAPSGIAADEDQVLAFKTRPAFDARFECRRVRADAGCIPMLPMVVRFSAQVSADKAGQARLVGSDGRIYVPEASGNEPFVSEVRFKGPFPEQTDFEVRLPAELKDDTGRVLENAARFPLAVATDEYPPLIKFPGEFGILEFKEGGVLPVTLRNVEPLVEGQQLQPGTAETGGIFGGRKRRIADDAEVIDWLKRVEEAAKRNGEWVPQHDADPLWKETTGTVAVLGDEADIEGFRLPKPEGGKAFEVVGIPLGKAGFYVVELASTRLGDALLGEPRTRYVATSALVTNLSVHFKWGRESSLVWVTSLDSADPVAGAEVKVSNYCTGTVLWRGETDEQGIARIGSKVLPEPNDYSACYSWASAPMFISARTSKDMSFALSSWSRGIGPGSFGLPVGWADQRVVAHSVLDRPLFRAGEIVSMKHFVRERVGSGVAIPAEGLPDKLLIRHEGSGQEFELPLAMDTGGVAESTWEIPREAKLGLYQITLREEASGNNWMSGEFRVEQFRVPTMKALVQPPAEPLVNAAEVPLDLYVGYLNGGGAGGSPVRLRTLVRPRSVSFPDYPDYSFGGIEPREGIEAGMEDEGDELRSKAMPAQVLPLVLDQGGAARTAVPVPTPLDDGEPRDLIAELEYQDANGEMLSTSIRVPLWSADLVLGVRPEGWAVSADQARVQVVALDLSGKPVANQAVSLDLFHKTTYSYRRRLVGGFYAYESKTETRRLGRACEGLTDASGVVSCEIQPGVSGQLMLSASTLDGRGNRAVASREVWVAGKDDAWFEGASDRMDLLPERKEYRRGDTARLQVRMPFREATALVTVEREGVLDGFVVPVNRESPMVEVPIKDGYAPNVYVSVLALRGRIPSWRKWVSGLAGDLGIELEEEGAVPTALVDLSKPAFRLGMTQLKVDWAPHRLDVRVLPDQEVFKVRDKAKLKIQVQRALGGDLPKDAEVALAAVDEGLLALKANASWELLAEMMNERGIEVYTSTAQMQVVGKRHYGRKALPDGGGGGGQAARELFDTLLLWRGRIPLNAEGAAEVEVPLNDSLTSFRLVAIASAGADLFGTGEASIRTTQDVMLHAGLAPLVREGDHMSAMFTVRNATEHALSLRVFADLAEDGGSATVPALEPKLIELAAGEAQELSWDLDVPVGADTLRWDVRAETTDGTVADRLVARQEVRPLYPVRVYQATLTQLDGSSEMPVERPADALPDRGGLRLSLKPRLADGVEGVVDYMKGYPYSCLEQQVSRAISLRDEKLWDGVAGRMAAYMDSDGLLKYFDSDALRGSDVLTAYVLSISNQAGRELPEDLRQRLLDALTGFVQGRLSRDSPLPTADLTVRKLAAVEALSRYGAATPELLDSITLEPNLWPTSAVLDWLGILQRVEEIPDRDKRLRQAQQILRARLNLQGTTMGFSTERSDALWWLMISPDMNAVRALLGLLEEPGWQEDLPRMVRGALGRQHRGHWSTTTANAWGVLALDAFGNRFEAQPVEGQTTATLAGQSGSIDWAVAADLPHPGSENTPGRQLDLDWPEQQARLSLTHQGKGKPWVTVQSLAAIPLHEPLFTGFHVNRTITPIEQRQSGVWTRGDVVRVTLELEAQSDMSWVVVDDPVPSGATILGKGLGGDSAMLTRDESSEGWVWPIYEERRNDAFRAYYEFVPKGRWTVEYTLRLNNAGDFGLPVTRVEAMYAPEMFAELPNQPLKVQDLP